MYKIRILRTISAALVLTCAQAHADFVVDNTSLPSAKTNLQPLPNGADPTKYFQASDYNSIKSAAEDLRTAAVNGKYQGFAEQASDPSPGNATNYLWAKTDHTLHLKINATDYTLASLNPPLIITKNAISFNNDETLQLKNTTAAAAGLVQNSPGLMFQNNGWDTGSLTSKTIKWLWQASAQETNPVSGFLALYSNVNGAGYGLVGAFANNGDFGVNGSITANQIQGNHFSGNGSTPGATCGTGAGVGATCSVQGTDVAGTISVATAGAPANNATIVTVNFATAFDVAPRLLIVPANFKAQDLAAFCGVTSWYYNQSDVTTAHFVIKMDSCNLSAGVTYVWNYMVMR